MAIFLYKTTNLLDGKFYYGVHTGPLIETTRIYFGSGKLLHAALKKHGRKNFVREILNVFETYDEAYAAEAALVTKEVTQDPMCYNLMVGGLGGRTITDEHRQALSEFCKARRWSEATKQKMSASAIGKSKSEETKARMRHPKQMTMKTCPSCGTIGAGANMTRYHFSNCIGKRAKRSWGRPS